MKVKRGLLYTASHEWVELAPDGTARVGISDFVPQKRGKISFVNLCDEGEYYCAGEVIGDAEAFKGVWDISAPISGTVLRERQLARRPAEPQRRPLRLVARRVWQCRAGGQADDGAGILQIYRKRSRNDINKAERSCPFGF